MSVREPWFAALQWPYVEEPHDGEHCADCGRGYARMLYRVSDDLWARLTPDGAKLLCPPCLDDRAVNAGVTLYWEAADSEFPTQLGLLAEGYLTPAPMPSLLAPIVGLAAVIERVRLRAFHRAARSQEGAQTLTGTPGVGGLRAESLRPDSRAASSRSRPSEPA